MLRGMPTDPAAWQRLAQHVVDRRGSRGWTQADVAERGGISKDRIQEIEKGVLTSYRPTTIGGLERGLEWEAGSVRDVLNGGAATPLEQYAIAPQDNSSATSVTETPEPAIPVGAGIDPEDLAHRAGLNPEEVREVLAFIEGIKARGTR